eukprot:10585078-Alexandrium_andersonii.AAC.1
MRAMASLSSWPTSASSTRPLTAAGDAVGAGIGHGGRWAMAQRQALSTARAQNQETNKDAGKPGPEHVWNRTACLWLLPQQNA